MEGPDHEGSDDDKEEEKNGDSPEAAMEDNEDREYPLHNRPEGPFALPDNGDGTEPYHIPRTQLTRSGFFLYD